MKIITENKVIENGKTLVECCDCGKVIEIDSDFIDDVEFINCPNCGKSEFYIVTKDIEMEK